jgi:hypothetical protein
MLDVSVAKPPYPNVTNVSRKLSVIATKGSQEPNSIQSKQISVLATDRTCGDVVGTASTLFN